eukprot:109285-Amphidinium_carterae.1
MLLAVASFSFFLNMLLFSVGMLITMLPTGGLANPFFQTLPTTAELLMGPMPLSGLQFKIY